MKRLAAVVSVLVLFLAAFIALGSIGQTQPAVQPVCVYSVPTPIASPGAPVALQCNVNGQLITSGSGGGAASFPTCPAAPNAPCVQFTGPPVPVTVPTIAPGLAVPVGVLCPSAAPAPINGGYSCTINSAGVLVVTTPAPNPTLSPGLQQGVTVACPSAAPAVQSSVYFCTINSLGQLNVTTPAPAPTGSLSQQVGEEPFPYTGMSTPNPTSTPLAVKAAPGTLGGARFWNGSAGTLFIGFYDALVAGVTLGTTVPKNVLPCPTLTFCFLPLPTGGVSYSTGITYLCGAALTGGVPTTGCGSNTTSLLMIDFRYHDDPCREADTHLRIGPTLALWEARKRCAGAFP